MSTAKPPQANYEAAVLRWLASLEAASTSSSPEGIASLFVSGGWLRDLLCFSWDFRTLEGQARIREYLSEPGQANSSNGNRLAVCQLKNIIIDRNCTIPPIETFTLPGSLHPEIVGVIAPIRFDMRNPARTGRGVVRLLPVQSDTNGESQWKADTLFVTVEDLVGFEESHGRPHGIFEGHRVSWSDMVAKRREEIERDPTVLIIGGSQSGLGCAARLGRLGVKTLVIEKSERVGNAWRNRYPNLTLHTPARHSSLLYHEWPKTFPQFLPKDVIADFLESYAVGQNLVVWTSSALADEAPPEYDEEKKIWTVEVIRNGINNNSSRVILRPKHIILAIGHGPKRIPNWPGMDTFQGTMYHSDDHKDVHKWAGKRAVVIGACNAAADAMQSFLSPTHAAASVTMVQRSATCVLTYDTASKILSRQAALETRTMEDGDLMNQSMPIRLTFRNMKQGGNALLKKMDAPFHKALTARGFRLNWELEPGTGEVGFLGFLAERTASGTILDTGHCQSIIDGKVGVKSGVDIERFDKKGLIFQNGTRLDADVIVLCTGYHDVTESIASLMGQNVALKIGQVMGLDAEGEMHRAYRFSGHPGLWIAAGAFQHPRYFSKHLAIQIVAEENGLVLPSGPMSSIQGRTKAFL